MPEVQREQYIAVVERLAGRWLPTTKQVLPAGLRARLIGERALDAYEEAADDGALIDAVAALSAADALGSATPELRERLGHLTESPVGIPQYETVASPAPGEPDPDRLCELLDLVDARAGESRTLAPMPLPCLQPWGPKTGTRGRCRRMSCSPASWRCATPLTLRRFVPTGRMRLGTCPYSWAGPTSCGSPTPATLTH